MELLIEIIIFVAIVVLVVFLVSFIIGGIDQAVRGPGTDPAATDPCADCNAYNTWYNSQNWIVQNAEFAYYWVKRIDCGFKGCPFSP